MPTCQPRTYRATIEAWLAQLLLPLAFFTLLTYTAVDLAGLSPTLAGIGLSVLGLFAFLDYLLPMLRNFLHIDERSIEGNLNGQAFMIYWTEVLAAWIADRQQQKFLCLGTRNGTLVIPLRFFNNQAIWQAVSAQVSPAALEPGAIQRLPDYQELYRAGEAAIRGVLEEGLSVNGDENGYFAVTDHWLFQVIGWAGLGFFLFAALSAARGAQYGPVLIFLILAGVFGQILVSWGLTEFGQHGITRHSLFRHGEIAWDDVRSIEVDPGDFVIVLKGEDCQMVIPGPSLWSGIGKKTALAVLMTQAERRRIPIHRTFTAIFKLTRGNRSRR